MLNPRKRFVSLIAMVTFTAIGIMFTCITEAKDLGKDKQQIAFNDSLQYVLKNAQVSAWPQSVLSYKVITSKMFKPVERQSASGVKAQMWPFKVEGSGVVLSSVDMGIIKNQQKYAVTVSYTAYAFYNELEEFKVEIGESKILSNRQITDDSTEPYDYKSSKSNEIIIHLKVKNIKTKTTEKIVMKQNDVVKLKDGTQLIITEVAKDVSKYIPEFKGNALKIKLTYKKNAPDTFIIFKNTPEIEDQSKRNIRVYIDSIENI